MLCFYRAMLRKVQNCYGKSYVRLSVALRYRGWNALKIISWLIILGFRLSVDPNIIVPEGTHRNIGQNRGGIWKKSGSIWRTKALISLKRGR